MHINLFHTLNRADTAPQMRPKPLPQYHQRSSETPQTSQHKPQDKVTLSQEAIKALQIDYRPQATSPLAKENDNKITSLEKWVDKAVTRTEANNGKIPFGMQWKLEYVNNRITKALNTDIGPNGHILNLTEKQQEKLNRINTVINELLSPTSSTASTKNSAEESS